MKIKATENGQESGIRPWFSGLILGASLIVAVGAAVIIDRLRESADECRQAQTELALLHTDVQELNGLEWEAISNRKLNEESVGHMGEIRTRMNSRLSDLGQLGSSYIQLAAVIKSYQAYVHVVDHEFELLADESIDEAEEFDKNKVDPAYKAMEMTLVKAGEAYDKMAVHTFLRVRAGIFMALFGGLGLIAWLVHHATQELRKREARYRSLFDANPLPLWVYDLETLSFREVNDAAVFHYGYQRQEFLSMTLADIRPASEHARLLANIAQTPVHSINEAGVWRHRRKDGSMMDVEITSHDLVYGGRPAKLVLALDITERQKAEASASVFSKLSKDLSFATAPEEAATIMGEAANELLGWDTFSIQLYSEETDTMLYLFDVDTVNGKRLQGTQRPFSKPTDMQRRILNSDPKLILREPDGSEFDNESRQSPSSLFVSIHSKMKTIGILSAQSYADNAYNEHDLRALQTLADQGGGALERIWVNEALRKSEAQLFQSQRLETVGKLAGGVAHEFNSILTAIIGQSELILADLPPNSPISTNTIAIREAADRAAILTQQLLAYGRKQILDSEALDLNYIITSMENALQHVMGGTVDVRIILTADLHVVKADPAQLEQVIVNMAMNARDNMSNGGKLTLETANVRVDQDSVGRYPDLKAGDYVMLAITDTGKGMEAEVKARVFEPFFTTKSIGQGTGLGLSTSYGIIKQSGGHISVYSEPGQGTTFKIYLPQVNQQAQVREQPSESIDLPRGTEVILLVEDDPSLREMAAELLRGLGYAVLTADNGVSALSLVQERGEGLIELLFTDMVMPLVNGKELSDRIHESHPETKTLFTSAYTENAIVHQGVLKAGAALLQKPFTPSMLALKVRQVLDQPISELRP